MKTVQITETNALNAFSKADEKGKDLLKELLDGQVDFKMKITDRVTSYETACAINGHSTDLPYPTPITGTLTKKQLRKNLLHMMEEIAEAYNEGWEPDMLDDSQQKWYPWMEINASASGFRFGCSICVCSSADAGSGVRLRTKELSDDMGRKFEKIISDHLLTFQK